LGTGSCKTQSLSYRERENTVKISMALTAAVILSALCGLASAQQRLSESRTPANFGYTTKAGVWSQSRPYYCWEANGSGSWASVNTSSPQTYCVGPYKKPPSSEPVSGSITAVDRVAKTFAVTIERKVDRVVRQETRTFSAANMKRSPQVGAIIDLIESPERFFYASCEECNAVCPGVCFMGANNCRCYLFHLRTR
jgi:hypothetical protein